MPKSDQHNDHLPPVWNIRAPRCREFTGRSDTLDELRQSLLDDHICILASPQAEMPGIGLSALALEYAYSHASDYQVIWWIDAEHLATMGIEYAQLGKALDMVDQKDDNHFFTLDKIKKRLEHNQGWLLIFDNVPDPALIPSFLPEETEGHVIITSPQPSRNSSITSLIIEPLDPASLDSLYPHSNIEEFGTDAHLNGNLLALNILAAYSDQTGEPMDDMLKAVQNNSNSLEDPTYAHAIQTALRFPLSILVRNYPASKDFLALCSFLNPGHIPLSLFDNIDGILTKRLVDAMQDDDAVQELISPLLELKLVSQNENGISIHPAIQHAVREGMSETPFAAWCNASVKLVNNAFPFETQYETPNPTCTRLIPHLLHATSIAEEHGIALEYVSTLLYQAGLYIHAHRLLEEAQMCYLRSINIAERKLGTIHQTIATRVNNLGIVEQELGNLDNAQTCFERAMEICETIYGPTKEAVYTGIPDSMLTMPLRNLCSVLEEKGNVKRAQRAFEKAMKIFVDVYGWNHSIVAECAHNFGNTWLKLHKHSKAQNCFIKAVRAEENAHECDNIALARYLNSLGIVLLKTDNPTLAAEQLGRALRLDQNEFGEQHVNVARDLTNLGHAYKQLKQLDDAEAVYRDALNIIEDQEEDCQADLASLLLNLGVILLGKSESAQARTLLDQSLQLHQEIYGENSRELISVQVNLGKALDGLDASTQAKAMYENSLAILKDQDPENHTDHATILYRLGRSHEKDKDYNESIKYYEQAMNMDTEHNGQDHPSVARDAYGVGSVLIRQGDTIVAMGHLTLALDIYERTVGKNHPKTRSVRKKLDEITH